jgi:hypothetical protein
VLYHSVRLLSGPYARSLCVLLAFESGTSVWLTAWGRCEEQDAAVPAVRITAGNPSMFHLREHRASEVMAAAIHQSAPTR